MDGTQAKLINIKKKEDRMSNNQTYFNWSAVQTLMVSIATVLVMALIVGGIVYATVTNNKRTTQVKLACIQSGGTYISSQCVMPR